MKSSIIVLLVAAGCARGSSGVGQDDASAVVDAKDVDASLPLPDAFVPQDAPLDAFVQLDAMPDAMPDAMVDAMVDAMPDAMVDAAVVVDAPPDACVPVTTQILVNPVFDLTPVGTGWTQTVIDPTYPLITDQDGVVEQTAPYKAWLGGIVAPSGSVTDVLYQDIAIPAGTTQLVLTGFYEVRSGESATDTNVYDTAEIAVTQTTGTPIVTINSFSNRTPTTTWTAINHTFAQNLSGQTVRLRMTSSNDFLNATSFYFDSLALNATHCP
ncbi:hypothetical protein BH11MYX3_BH11MYX3_31380 [soil metagenome]